MLGSLSARALRENFRSRAPTHAERSAAIRAGWNDAAWGHPMHVRPTDLGRWYDLGYTGGRVYRQRVRQTGVEQC